MLAAVLEDFSRVAGVEPVTLVDLAGPKQEPFQDLAGRADFTLVIAPESDGILETRCRWVEEAGGRLLGPSPEAVRRTADKWELGRHLQACGVPTPLTFRAEELPSRIEFPLVLKPRHGAGSQATFLVKSVAELPGLLKQARGENGTDELLVQEHVPGQAASVAFLIGPQGRLALLPAAQSLSGDGRFRYEGGALPLPEPLAGRARALAARAAAIVPGLQGYVGVDLVMGAAADGSADRVIEINPRLTTSYVGLRAMTATNLAGAMLDVVRGTAVPEPVWNAGGVRFGADGTVCAGSRQGGREREA